MQFKLVNIRQNETENVPIASSRVTFIHTTLDGTIRADHTISGKSEIFDSFKKGDLLLAAWTGEYHTDIFELDVEIARKMF